MESLYTSGQYLEKTGTWHAEDSQWKARQIARMVANNGIVPTRVAEVGCGAGHILHYLSTLEYFRNSHFKGYDISAQAIELANPVASAQVEFFNDDLFTRECSESFDLLLVIDVFEHVPDYLGFLQRCKARAAQKIYHVPLDLSVSSVLRNSYLSTRSGLGHLHYFTADGAIACLEETGHRIKDHFYTNAGLELFTTHPSVKRALANIPRWLLSLASRSFAARLLGGYSLLILAE